MNVKNKQTFYDWCVNNNHREFLDRWDYDLNIHVPDKVSYRSDQEIYFKCPMEKHPSRAIRLRWISNLDTSCECNECKLESDSFGKWCEGHNLSILDLWDYEKNTETPYEVLRASNKKYYFKCPRGLHESHLQIICNITLENAPIHCNQCNSIGQWIVDNYGADYLNLIWDYDKNTKSPFEVSYGASRTKIFVKCSNDLLHPSYPITPCNLIRGKGCPTCKNEKTESNLQQQVREYVFETYGCQSLHEYACTLKPINPKTGYILPYDNQIIINDNINLIIEVMGIQHYKTTGYIRQAAKRHGITCEEELTDLQWRDELKKQYALDSGYFYLAIPYWTEKDQSYKQLIDDKIHEILYTTK